MPPTQQERREATRDALVAAARSLFTERSYADVPADEIVAAAGVSRGALYHHFGGKQELFEEVFEDLERDIMTDIAQIMGDSPGPMIVSGLRAFLDVCTKHEVVKIGLTEAPAVLGWPRWREIESKYGLGLVRAAIASTGAVDDATLDVASHIVVSALIEAALVIAHAEDKQAARSEAETALTLLLGRLLPG